MGDILDDFAAWLRQWFSAEEVATMLEKDWGVKEGVELRGARIMNIEEFLHLAASFIAERALGKRGSRLKVVANYDEVYVLDIETRTVVVAAAYQYFSVTPNRLNSFLQEMARQAEEARDHYMSLRGLIG